MELASGMTALLPFHGGSHVPEMLGSFHLDDHNVEEWSDATRPGTHHRARKEVGKWTNSERNADIKYQKQEDNTRFHGGEEKQRQEMIQGKAPDSEFQIIRTQHQIQDNNDKNGSRFSTTSTSYQMSSSNGVRSTTKTQSNKTTSKTVVVSGGGGVRHDEFENLKLSCLPLDTSTQREKINVSRSGTMGVRRPPTRRHHQPPSTTAVMEDGDTNGALNFSAVESMRLNSEISIKEPATLDENSLINETPQQSNPTGAKKISPKICVGFPADIQMELQTKLRGPATPNGSGSRNLDGGFNREASPANKSNALDSESPADSHKHRLRVSSGQEFKTPFVNSFSSTNQTESKFHSSASFDYSQRRKSYGFEPFENGTRSAANKTGDSFVESFSYSNNFVNGGGYSLKPISQQLKPPPLLTSSWDLIQNISREREPNNNHLPYGQLRPGRLNSPSKDSQQIHSFSSYLSSMNESVGQSSNGEYSLKTKFNPFIEQDDQDQEPDALNVVTNKNILNKLSDSTLDALGANPLDTQRKISQFYTDNKIYEEPDLVLLTDANRRHHNSMHQRTANKAIETTEEATPDLLNQMSFKSYMPSTPPQYKRYPYASFHSGLSAADTRMKKHAWEDDLLANVSEKDSGIKRPTSHLTRLATTSEREVMSNGMRNSVYIDNVMGEYATYDEDQNVEALDSSGGDDEFFTNDKKEFLLTRHPLLLDLTSNKMYQSQKQNEINDALHSIENHATHNDANHADDDNEIESNSSNLKKATQVSQTWISAADVREQESMQHARDHDVTTSIYAINDPYRKPLKKVGFCKTEVHFTPEPGRFQIVESDENKPSTIHLYRRRKRNERKTAEFLRNALFENNDVGQMEDTAKKYLNSTTTEEGQPREKMGTSFTNESLFSKRSRGASNDQLQDENDNDDLKIAELELLKNNTPPTSSVPHAFTPTSSDKTLNHNYYKNNLRRNIYDFKQVNDELYNQLKEEEPAEDVLIVSSSKVRPFSPSTFKEIANEDRSTDNKNLFTHLNNLNLDQSESNNLSFYRNNEIDEESTASSPNHTISTQFGDLKIQKYLKQLKAPSSQGDVDSVDGDDFNRLHREKILRGKNFRERMLNELSERKGRAIMDEIDSDTNFRYDNVLYENGSFVPLATRRSLIEMNNRNRKQNNLRPTSFLRSLAGTVSDNSSTMSNYSLPCSDNSHRDRGEYYPLKLTAMEATVAATGSTPQITSVELRYALDQTNDLHKERSLKSHIYIPDTARSSSPVTNRPTKFQCTNNFDNQNHRSFEKIPSPVMPSSHFQSIQSDRPLRGERRARSTFSLSPTQSPSVSPTVSQTKPPTPILPIHFSIFAPDSAPKPAPRASKSFNATGRNVQERPLSKSIVQIGEDEGTGLLEPTPYQLNEESNYAWKNQIIRDESGAQPKSGSSILRSLTFPKATRPEPEWVSKAKSREARMTDWSLVEKQSGAAKQTEPPWLVELRVVKNKNSPTSEEAMPVPKVYPWNQGRATATKEEMRPVPIEKVGTSKSGQVKDEADGSGKAMIKEPKEMNSSSPKLKPVSTGKLHGKLVQTNSRSTVTQRKAEKNHQDKTTATGRVKPTSLSPLTVKTKSSRTTVTNGQDGKVLLADRDSTKSPADSKISKHLPPPMKTSKANATNISSPNKISQRQVKPAAPPKPPRPPPPNLSVAGVGAKPMEPRPSPNPRLKKRTNASTSDVEASPLSTRSNTPIYLHPLVKISKLPVKTPPKNSPTPDGKRTPTSRTKLSVPGTSESKGVSKGTSKEGQSKILAGGKKSVSPRATPTIGVVLARVPLASPKVTNNETDSSITKKKR